MISYCISSCVGCVFYCIARSIIYHFLVTENLFPVVTDYRFLQHVDTLSDHNPILDGACIDYLNAEEMFVRDDKVFWKLAKPNDI